MNIEISFPVTGSRMRLSEESGSDDILDRIKFVKQISSKIRVTKLNDAYPDVELIAYYTEDFESSVSFAEFDSRARTHAYKIIAEMKLSEKAAHTKAAEVSSEYTLLTGINRQ